MPAQIAGVTIVSDDGETGTDFQEKLPGIWIRELVTAEESPQLSYALGALRAEYPWHSLKSEEVIHVTHGRCELQVWRSGEVESVTLYEEDIAVIPPGTIFKLVPAAYLCQPEPAMALLLTITNAPAWRPEDQTMHSDIKS